MSAWQLAPRYNHTYGFPDTPVKDHEHFITRPTPPLEPRTPTLASGFRKYTPLHLKNTHLGPPSPGLGSPKTDKDLTLAKIDYGGLDAHSDNGKIRGSIRLYSESAQTPELPWTSAARKPFDNETVRELSRYDAPSAKDIQNWSNGKENESPGPLKLKQFPRDDVRVRLDTADLARRSLRLGESRDLDSGMLGHRPGDMFNNTLPKQGRYPDLPVPKRYEREATFTPWRTFKGHSIPSASDLVTWSNNGLERNEGMHDKSLHSPEADGSFSFGANKHDSGSRQATSRLPIRPWTPHARYGAVEPVKPPVVDFDRSKYMFSRGNSEEGQDRSLESETKIADTNALMKSFPSRRADFEHKSTNEKSSASISYNSHRIYASNEIPASDRNGLDSNCESPPNLTYQRPPPPVIPYDDRDYEDNTYERIDTRFTNSIGAQIGNLKPSSPSSKPGSPTKSILKKGARREAGLSRSNTFHGHSSRDMAGSWMRPSGEAHGFPQLGGNGPGSGGLKRSNSVKRVTFIV